MTEIEAREIFERNNAIKEGHFVLRGGEHSKWYVNKDIILQDTALITQLCYGLTSKIINEFCNHLDLRPDPEVIIGPQMGGALMAQWIAYYLTHYFTQALGRHKVLALCAEKYRNGFKLRPQAIQAMNGKKVVLVDDIFQRGTSFSGMVKTINNAGGIVIGAGVLWHRGQYDLTNFFNCHGNTINLVSLINTELTSWPNEELCPLCPDTPINTDLGYGKEFLKQKRAAVRFAETSHRLQTA